MTFAPDSFAATYAEYSESRLLTLARDYDSLTEPAQSALRAEFARRGLEPPLVDEDSDEPTQRQLVTLRQYRDLSEAIVARSMLEAAGITVYLRDENLVRLDWQISNFIGGIRLQVEASDAEAANELLSQPVPEAFTPDGEPTFEPPHCPKCGSVEITFEGSDRRLAIASTFVLHNLALQHLRNAVGGYDLLGRCGWYVRSFWRLSCPWLAWNTVVPRCITLASR